MADAARIDALERRVADLADAVRQLQGLGLPQTRRSGCPFSHLDNGDSGSDTADSQWPDACHPASPGPEKLAKEGAAAAAKVSGYRFAESAWDAAVCVGHRSVGPLASALLLALMAMNVLIQGVFCHVVRTAFTENPYGPDVRQALRWWRTGFAHSADQVDHVSLASLATRVCNFDHALASSGSQLGVAKDVSEYGVLFVDAGPVMCSLALACWFLVVTSEVSKVGRCIAALWALKVGPRTELMDDGDGSLRIVRISRGRLCCVGVSQGVRLLIALSLGLYGVEYLVYTETAKDLLLNAVALQFVLDIDELLFGLAAPERVRVLLSRLQPVPLGRPTEIGGVNLSSVVMFVVPVMLTIVAVVLSLMPAIAERVDAWTTVCGGNLAFAVASDGLGRVHWSKTAQFDAQEYSSAEYIRSAVRDIINKTDASEGGVHLYGATPLALYTPTLDGLMQDVRDQTVEEATRDLACVDADDGLASSSDRRWPVGRLILRSVLGSDLKSCSDVLPLCLRVDLAGTRARQWCPVTCGCASPLSPLLTDTPSAGCPAACHQLYLSEAKVGGCTEPSDNRPRAADGRFAAYVRGVKSLFVQHGYESPQVVELARGMEERGCAALRDGGAQGAQLCLGKVESANSPEPRQVRRAHWICPVACGCDGSGLPGSKEYRLFPEASVHLGVQALELRGACSTRYTLVQDYFFIGHTENGSPLFRSSSGVYVYFGPDCHRSGQAKRWVLSTALCNDGYFAGYVQSNDSSMPPPAASWFVSCLGGWKQNNITLSPRQ